MPSPVVASVASTPSRAPGSALLLLLTLLSALMLQTSHGQTANPLADSGRAVYAGGVLFRAQCATCHGADATGISSIDAPDLTRMWQARGYADHEVFAIIQDGIPGTIMPAHDFTDTEIWMLVSFLRSVGVRGVETLPAGDSTRGAELFVAQCAECHRVGLRGGVLGPDLSGLLARSSLDAITMAVRDPDALVPRDYKTVVVDADGTSVAGVLKNEDAFSLQIVTTDQQLRAFRKQSVSVSWPDYSLMPAYSTEQLGDQELLDILNFIQASSEERL